MRKRGGLRSVMRTLSPLPHVAQNTLLKGTVTTDGTYKALTVCHVQLNHFNCSLQLILTTTT